MKPLGRSRGIKGNNRKGEKKKRRRKIREGEEKKEKKWWMVGDGGVGAGTGNVLESISRALRSVSCVRHTGSINKEVCLWGCVCVCPETCINHASDEQMKSMIPETSSEINLRDHVRDVSSNWHQSIHPSWAGVQDPFLLGSFLTLGCTLPNSLSFSSPITGFPMSPGRGRCVSSPGPASAGESFLLLNFHTFSICLEPFTALFFFLVLFSLEVFPFIAPPPTPRASQVLRK